MECPYCSKEMLCGYLWNDRSPVQWIPDGKKTPMLNFKVAKDAVALGSKLELLSGYKAQAYYCNECRIVIAKAEDE